MKTMTCLDLRINQKKDISILQLVDKQYIGKKIWVAKCNKSANSDKYSFLDKCHYSTVFLPKDIEIGDEIHAAVAKVPESLKMWRVIAKKDYSIVLKEET